MPSIKPPQAAGLYHPENEHDACGVAFVAKITGDADHGVVGRALYALENLEHRGAAGADPTTGDGAGILLQLPDAFFRAVAGVELPAAGRFGVGVLFMPTEDERHDRLVELIEQIVAGEGQRVLGWRDVPVDEEHVGVMAGEAAPRIRQVFVGAADELPGNLAFERKLYVIRRLIEKAAGPDLAIPSFSSRTVVYKGMLTAPQMSGYYPDLKDERMVTRLALVHSRFSTNTFPSWELAHPYRMLAHNGEINTLRGNVNWMRARESQLMSECFGDDLDKVMPVVREGGSDSATFDNVLELLVLDGRPITHAVMMMVPEAYRDRTDLPPAVRGFYDYHSCVMEPWDGPAVICFTDGTQVGATLDRNGLRPGRWVQTIDGYVVLASETGVIKAKPNEIVRKGRLQPGKVFLVDLEQGRIVEDDEVKAKVAGQRPYGEWYAERVVHLDDLPERAPRAPRVEPLRSKQLAFGYSQEDLRMTIAPMAVNGEEPAASMGNDASLAVLSDRQPPLFAYFKQLFAQVTNPPIDPIRESVVMSLATSVGAEVNLLDESPQHAHQLFMKQPILRNHELEKLRQVSHDIFHAATIDLTWPVEQGPDGMERRIQAICDEASTWVERGANILILSDRNLGAERVAIPSLLAVSAVHHHLVRAGTRLRCGLVIETGEPREIHHMATLIGYGAAAINPYLMFESLDELADHGRLPVDLDRETAEQRIVRAIGKGLLKTFSKMGISTIQSYCGAQIFEAVGLDPALIDRYFTGTSSRIGGVGIDVLAKEALERHFRAYPRTGRETLPVGGVLQWRRDGERHIWNPDTIALLQHAVRAENGTAGQTYDEFARAVNDEAARKASLRGLMKLREAPEPIPLDEVESAEEIVKRFSTGAMSLGAISRESHEALAIAMNRIGGRSNTGEGGEDPSRFMPDENGDERRSAIKQIASGRFGVTPHYLVNADQLQIKMAQGAKPGEGGQLPGHKVDDYIAWLRNSTPGVGLISPPPHHDIYSIEDLKQLIYDLRCSNPEATVSVKLVSEVGVGTVAAGVAKANADHIVVSGHDGGTGASPQSSIQSAGTPWEIGLAETQQTLLLNDLRSRVVVQADGQMKTGRDVVIAALLGADEVGFSTAPLIAMGCIMMRVCHLNTCPVGIATQNEQLRKRFQGTPDHVVKYLFFVAEETRQLMASLGVRTFEEMIGRTDLLEMDEAIEHWKARGVDLSAVFEMPEWDGGLRCQTRAQEPVLDDALDWELLRGAEPALARGERVELSATVRNVNRTVGGILSSQVAKRLGPDGLAEGTIEVALEGSAGQSFGAWLMPGITFTLTGETNDYTGKGLAGGVLTVRPAQDAAFDVEDSPIVGNTVLYGATGGRAFFRGLAGERFAVRNSGAHAVVEGVGDHGCEYMTGGRVVVLGATGRNFAAGMSGGVAYVYDEHSRFSGLCNTELVDLDPLDEHDEAELKDLVAEHAQRTGSQIAQRTLDDWDACASRFVKVMPRDYKRALAETAAREQTETGVAQHAPEPAEA
ncbi:glutamate synthase large subunit [Conexibacter woesei]|uniref:Glutamate synthase (Ferredoxin) n=1 Tax=Conexibacter woesei (strain DSM 14684 / CCUG 47730 / CIP 108061 / JCM 11494 / NBRC 100937 / ID131577) TaxID=469383 RepID=D3F268_CONWI|nr:glutamate synthase large subunit [Conexibacter woesei]ADB50243.1 Glutamate synthase (ferredoxin) [Conexibacter woesei DSM 14684]